uniref:Uncharacterized protein n=1 Tax=Cacopsylla melanoneura TaxID=428564 RepID=A0A8D8YE05_9HEMI
MEVRTANNFPYHINQCVSFRPEDWFPSIVFWKFPSFSPLLKAQQYGAGFWIRLRITTPKSHFLKPRKVPFCDHFVIFLSSLKKSVLETAKFLLYARNFGQSPKNDKMVDI